MWRFRWRGGFSAWVVCLFGWVGVLLMPPVFEANARIYVNTENALKALVQGSQTRSQVLNEVTVVTREMLSRPNLAEVARSTDLDLRAKTPEGFEALLTNLSDRIQVRGSRDNIYTIAFQDVDRAKAVAVVDALVNTFVEKSLGAGRTDSSTAQSFLQSQIAEYEARLTAAEDRLANFKRDNVEFMPGEQGDYFARLQNAEAELESTGARLRLAEERRSELMRQLAGEEPVFGIMGSSQTLGTANSFTSNKIRELEIELEQLRLQYTDKHPRIAQILDTLDFLREEQKKEAESVAQLSGDGSAPLEMNPVYQNMRIQLSNTEVDIAAFRAQLQQHQRAVTELQTLVDTIPRVEAELSRLNRDYDVVKAQYDKLLVQLETANLTEDAEDSLDDVQFRIIEPPFSELEPAGPQRQLFISSVLIVALGIGGALTVLFDQLNPVFFSGRDVTAITGLPILGAVSLVLTPVEKMEKRKSRLHFVIVLGLLLAIFVAAVLSAETLSPAIRDLAGLAT
jgi:polysaccharide chain length determinant protein (PEP-CTERM system associated)